MPPTYLAHLHAFTHFLTAYTHTLLYLRALYPRTSFLQSRFHSTALWQSRHPLVCEWIQDAVAAVHEELLAGTVARIAIVIFRLPSPALAPGDAGGGGNSSPAILERYMFDVSAFPVVARADHHTEMEWEPVPAPTDAKGGQKPLDVDIDTDLSEQFRAALVMLTTRCSRLDPLPPSCSFNISMELKDEADMDPPIGRSQPWIPVQPSLQKTGRNKSERHDGEGRGADEGGDLGGVRVTPIRTVEAGVFRFETWIEEGRAKFEMAADPAKSSSASSRS